MENPKQRVILHAGDYYFGNAQAQIHTLLGSCISIVLWHPEKKIGGMCHYALPYRFERNDNRLNPRFADDCLALFERSAKRNHTNLSEFKAKIFGGGNMYEKAIREGEVDPNRRPVGEKNVEAAFELLSQRNIPIQVAHVGEFGHRRIIFDIETGDVWVKFSPVIKMGNQNSLSGVT